MLLIDTNVISELMKAVPDPAVSACFDDLASDTVFTAAICEAEIRYGLARMPRGRKRDELIRRMETFFDTGLQDQVLPFDRACASRYGEIRHAREAAGKPITIADAMIAATALAYGVAAVLTRNTKDFEDCGVALVNPWVAA